MQTLFGHFGDSEIIMQALLSHFGDFYPIFPSIRVLRGTCRLPDLSIFAAASGEGGDKKILLRHPEPPIFSN